MSYNTQNNSIPNWQDAQMPASAQMSAYQQMLPSTPTHGIYNYPHSSSSPMIVSPHNQFAANIHQMSVNSEYFPSNEHQYSLMSKNFPSDFVTPTRYQHQGIIRHKPSPLKSAVINPPKRLRPVDDDCSPISEESKGVKGIPIDSAFYNLQRFSFDGCTFAESVAQTHSKRPCFKKIDLLLSRLKNDLNVYHNILSNVNSQGTAWAIKDFIFAYSRVINAWIILRGYVYDQTEGLDSLRNEFDDDYFESFLEWQNSTLRMMKSLMRTVENLNTSAQFKSGVGNGVRNETMFKSDDKAVHSKEFLETFQKTLFLPQCAPNSEEIQIRNHHSRAYFRAGVLKPLMIDTRFNSFHSQSPGSAFASTSSTPSSSNADECFNWWSPVESCESPIGEKTKESDFSERLYNRGKSSFLPTTPNESENPFDFMSGSRAKKTLLDQFNSVNVSD